MIVDIVVTNLQILGAIPSPRIPIPMPNDDVGKVVFFATVGSERLNNRTYVRFKGKAARKAARIVDKFGSIGTSGEYGSIDIDEHDFIKEEKGPV
jgi:hypothetical protein